ncbi:unnamed protein product [Brassica oleracea var. botrytis]
MKGYDEILRSEKRSFMLEKMVEEDDMTKFKGYTANAINYYMNQHGITKEETYRELEKMIGNSNKIVNEEYFEITNISRRILN